ncbi:aminoglycoside phosphotransferase family protein [Kribbella steppae]|uniref:aminoglycoside phosphotransferase family protein n=1 Tax=Kribbella steppae TaxID=2512223 RepID=UPI001F5440AE|nr:aminoglycoside phosphotransferase family protein [Kribbella steppae]
MRGRRDHLVLRSLTPRIDVDLIATGAAALEVAERHGLPAPRLLAKDLDGRAAGAPATLETFVGGSTAWPSAVSIVRLHAAGAALAQVHAIPLEPQPHLPLRTRPIAVDDFAGDRRRGRMATTPLLRTADEWIQSLLQPQGATVFLHGDVWPGNMAWTADTCCTLIDWKTAGVGDPGVDIGELRKQIAITYGPEAIAGVVDGWEQTAGRSATNIDYWDAVAALNTPTDLGPVATARRDAFLRAALERLGGEG